MLSHPQPQLVLSSSELATSQELEQQRSTYQHELTPSSEHATAATAAPPHATAATAAAPSHTVSLAQPSSNPQGNFRQTSTQANAASQSHAETDLTHNGGLQSTVNAATSGAEQPSSTGRKTLVPLATVSPSSSPRLRSFMVMAGPSSDPDCSPSQRNGATLQPVTDSPSMQPGQDPSSSPSQLGTVLQPVLGSPSLDPSQRLYVSQRVKELQSQQGSPLSPERSASSSATLSAMLSPRSGDWRAASASPRQASYQPTVFSSPRKGSQSRAVDARHGTEVSNSSVQFDSPAKQPQEKSKGKAAATSAAASSQYHSESSQSGRASTTADLKRKGNSAHMRGSPEYELPPDATDLSADRNAERADRLEMSSSAVELQSDDDSASLVSQLDCSSRALQTNVLSCVTSQTDQNLLMVSY